MQDLTGKILFTRLNEILLNSYALRGIMEYGVLEGDIERMLKTDTLGHTVTRHLQAYQSLLYELGETQAGRGVLGVPIV